MTGATGVPKPAPRGVRTILQVAPTHLVAGGSTVRSLVAAASLAVLALSAVPPAHAQTPADSAAIRAAALDYIEGWYAGDADRVARALHPQLAAVGLIVQHDGRVALRRQHDVIAGDDQRFTDEM